MSLILLTNPPSVLAVSGDWTDFIAREDKSNIGTGLSIPIFTLTNWDGSTTKPQIAQGSIIEVGGSIYQADADTALTDEGGLSDGTVHIKLVPAGGGATVVPTLTNDSIPAWDAVKGGWYDIDDKFLPFEMTKASAVYTVKSEYVDQNKLIARFTDGALKLSGSLTGVTTATIATGNITTGNITTGNITTNNVVTQNMTGEMKWEKYFKADSVITENTIYDNIATWVPTIGDRLACHGQVIGGQFAASGVKIRGIVRSGANQITLYGAEITAGGNYAVPMDNGSGSVASESLTIMSTFGAMN